MEKFTEYLTGLGPLELIGVSGFFCYLMGFGAVQLGLLDGNSAAYSSVNILAASLVAIGLIAEFNLSSALIQASWIVLGCVGLLLRLRRHLRAAPRKPAGPKDVGRSDAAA